MPTTANNIYTLAGLEPVMAPELAKTRDITLAASASYAQGLVLGEKIGNNEVQTITIDADGGTFTVTFGGQTTSALAWNVSAANMLIALEALSTIGDEDVTVTLDTAVYTVTFQNQLGYQNVAAMTTGVASLTKGQGAGTATVATTVAGSAGTRGEFAAYDPDASDGTQYPKCVLKYASTVDASKNITVGDGVTQKSVAAYVCGIFDADDFTGLDENAVSLMNGQLIEGSIDNGIFKF